MPSIETRYHVFGRIGGTTRATSDQILIAEAPGLFAPEARKGDLYIIVEASQTVLRSQDLCQLAMRTIQKAFYGDPSFSVTSSLRKAIVAANQALYQHNFSTAQQKRGTLGIICAVLKDNDLYLARVAPGRAFILSENALRPIPALHMGEQMISPQIAAQSLGASLTIEPEFYRAVMRPGDAVLLCTSTLAALLDQESIRRLLLGGDAESLSALLDEVCRAEGIDEGQALTLTIHAPLSQAAQTAPLSRSGVSERGALAMRSVSEKISRATGELSLLLRGSKEQTRRRHAAARLDRNDAEQQQLKTLPDEPVYTSDPAPRPRPLSIGESLEERLKRQVDSRPSGAVKASTSDIERGQLPPSALLGETVYHIAAEPRKAIDLGDPTPGHPISYYNKPITGEAPIKETMADRMRSPFAQLGRHLNRQTHKRRMRRPPPQVERQVRRQSGLSYRREGPPFPWIWLLLLVSLVTVLFLYGMNLSRENQVQQTTTNLDLAEQAVAQINQAPDEATAYQLLQAASEAIDNVKATEAVTATVESRQRFETIQREYDRIRNSLQRVSFFANVSEVAQHPIPGALFDKVVVPPPPSGITNTQSFGSIYLFDANAGILYRQSKSGGPVESILRAQDRFGPLPVGKILGVEWRFDTITAVTHNEEGGPYNYYFQSGNIWQYSLLAGSEEWGRPSERFRIANYEGNLYVWGATPSNILRYLSGSYGVYPIPWIQNEGGKSFENALDIAVDGKIYLLQPDGHVLVFSANEAGDRGFEREIVPQGINPPVTTVARFAVTGPPESGFIFLVDGYNSRIVQLDKITGEFIQQIKLASDAGISLDHLTNIFVDSSSSRPMIYMVNGATILRSALPDPPRPLKDFSKKSPTAIPTPTPSP